MHIPTKTSRLTAILAAASALALAVSACGQGADPGAVDEPSPQGTQDVAPNGGDGEQVELRVAWWGGDARHPRTQEAIDAFMVEHPNIHVTGEFSDWSGYWDRMATATAGGGAPDVLQMDEMYLASYADRDSLVDLETLSDLDTAGLDPEILSLGRSQGTLYGMPISTTAFALVINDDILDELGLELPDSSTWTWDEFTDFAIEVSEVSNGEILGAGPLTNGYSLQLWARQHGEALFADGNVSISPETMAGYYELALNLSQSGAAASASRQAEMAGSSLDQTDLATGRQATAFYQNTQISALTAATGGANLSTVLIPTVDGDQSYSYLKPGMYWSISSQSDHQDAAAAFVDFMVNSEEAGAILGTERGIPANAGVRDSIAGELTEAEVKAVEFVTLVEENLGEAPDITPNGASDIDTVILRYMEEVLFETKTPQEAAEAFIADLQSGIDSAS